MDKKSSQILRALFDPNIVEFVDWKKFLASRQFAEISQDLIDHFIRYGDFSYIKKILDKFRESRFFKSILLWFCDSAGLDFSFSGDELALRRAENSRVKEGGFESYMIKYVGTARDVGKEQALKIVISQDKHSLVSPIVDSKENARRNEMVKCSMCGVELDRKNISKHNRNFHALSQSQDSIESKLKTASQRTKDVKIRGELRSDVKKLKSVPLEYQASVYAKIEKEKRDQQDVKRRERLQTLKSTAKQLKEELRKTSTASVRVELEKKISACDKAIKNSPKPRRRWSPILSGSFESSK